MKILLRILLILLVIVLFLLASFRLSAALNENQNAESVSPENGQVIVTEFGKIHVSIWGEENSIPVLMTHGMAAWGGLWEENARFLAKQNYRVISVDLPPFGFSSRKNQDFSRSTQAARLAALTSAMNLKKFYIVGHSYGGGIAMELALRNPDQVLGLILVCPVMDLLEPGEIPVTKSVPILLQSDVLAQSLVSTTITNPLATRFLVKKFMHQKDALTDRHVEILQRPRKISGNTSNMVVWLRQFLEGDKTAISRMPNELEKISFPYSLIWGEKDTTTPIAQGKQLARIIRPQRFKMLTETGHMPQLETPELFNDVLLEQLNNFQQNQNNRQ